MTIPWKQYLGGALFVIILHIGSVNAASIFADTVKEVDPSWSTFLEKEYITRYDLAHYLSHLRCQDCVYPDEDMVDTYDEAWLKAAKTNALYALDDLEMEAMSE